MIPRVPLTCGLLLCLFPFAGCREQSSSRSAPVHSAAPSATVANPARNEQTSPVDPLKKRTYALAVDGPIVFGGTTAGVVAWELEAGSPPRELASLTLAGSVNDLVVFDRSKKTLAVSTGPTGIAWVDASNAVEGKLVLRNEHPWGVQARGGCHAPWKVAPIEADKAYVACGGGGVGELVVGLESQPRITRTADAGGYVRDLAVLDESAGLAKGKGSRKRVLAAADRDGLSVLDFTTAEPKVLARLEIPGQARAVVVREGMAYVAAGDAGLQIVDVRDPTNPSVVGSFDPDVTDMARGVLVQDGVAYVCFGESGLLVVDVRDPAAPQRLGSFDPERSVNRVMLQDSMLMMANDAGGLLLLDVTDHTKPAKVFPLEDEN